MPYITQESRLRVADEMYAGGMPERPGELNFLLSFICREYLLNKGTSYTTLNEIIGALECAKTEFYRRVVIPYENQKCNENGDIYEGVLG